MIRRRQFIGSVAAAYATISTSQIFANTIPSKDPNWRCDVVSTVPHNFAGRHPVVTGVSLQPKGDLIAIAGDDHAVSIYDRIKKQYVQHLSHHRDWIRSVKFSPDGTQLVTAGNDRTMRIWNVGSWDQPLMTRKQPNAIIETVFANSGKLLATVGFDSFLRIYDLEGGTQSQLLECACGDNHAVAFSKDGKLLAAAGRSGTIRVWQTADWKKITEFKPHRKRIRSLEFHPNGQLISASDDQTIKLTDPKITSTSVSLPRIASKLYSTAMIQGRVLATGGSDNQIQLWHTDNQKKAGVLKGHTGTVSCLDYQGGILVSGSFDTHVRIWHVEDQDIQTGNRQTRLGNGWNPKLK
ncbi:MAG: WD40 repeat domain-containing protein [Planctomycetota bacterium]